MTREEMIEGFEILFKEKNLRDWGLMLEVYEAGFDAAMAYVEAEGGIE